MIGLPKATESLLFAFLQAGERTSLLDTTLLDTGLLTYTVTQVEQATATNLTMLDDRDAVNRRRRQWEDTLNTNTVGNFANREGLGQTFSFDLDYVTTELLDPGLLALGNSVVYHDGVSGAEGRQFGLVANLLVNEGNSVHGCNNF
jgi:hypothetical protein